jgi:hypothetical protein
MESIIINKESDFKNETISSMPLGINNIMFNTNDKNFNLKKDDINNIKPMLSNNSNTIVIPDGKKVKIKPMIGKKVPVSTFSAMANPKKNIGVASSDEDSVSSGSSANSESDDILSNNSKSSLNSNNRNNQQNYQNNDDDEDDEEYSDDDYSSIESNRNKNKQEYSQKSSYDEDDEDDEDDDSSTIEPKKQKSYEEIQREKQQLLFNLERLQKQGYPPSKKYTMASSYEDMQFEHERLKKQRDVEKSIKFSRKILMAFVSGAEFLNNRFDPCDVKLDGWSENVMENVNDYDEVFEELHEKYGESIKMAPELRLIAMVGGSAFMYHLTNSLFKSASPKLSDILKQNPDIMKNISEAAVKNMSNTVDQQFGQDDIIGNLMKNGMNMKMNQQRNQSGPSGPSPFMGNRPQQKMNGPVGIDELLSELNDNDSVSSKESITIKSSGKRNMKTNKKGGIELDIR